MLCTVTVISIVVAKSLRLCFIGSAANHCCFIAVACSALNFLSSELTDKGLAALGALKDLQCLKLYQAGISCSGLNTFAELPAGLGVSSLVLYGLGGLTSLSCLGEDGQVWTRREVGMQLNILVTSVGVRSGVTFRGAGCDWIRHKEEFQADMVSILAGFMQ